MPGESADDDRSGDGDEECGRPDPLAWGSTVILREPKTEYVREALEGLPCTKRNRDYAKDLLLIEKHARDEISSYSVGMGALAAKDRHPEAWEAIHREVDPEYLERKRREREEAQEERDERVRERREEWQEWWSEWGGEVE